MIEDTKNPFCRDGGCYNCEVEIVEASELVSIDERRSRLGICCVRSESTVFITTIEACDFRSNRYVSVSSNLATNTSRPSSAGVVFIISLGVHYSGSQGLDPFSWKEGP